MLRIVEILAAWLLSEVLVRATGTDAQFQMIDFRLMFVMLIGTVYGLNAGVLAAVLASVSLAAGYLRQGTTLMLLFYEPSNWLAFIVNLGALIGMTTVMLVQLYGQSRICYAMSRDGLFPKFFGEVHPKYRTPFKGTWFFGILTAIAGGFININVLFELVNIGTLSAFIIVSAGILWMRKTQPDAHRGFRAPGVPFTPICAIIFCLILIFGLNWETWVRFAVWFALGLVVYFTYSRKHSQLNEPGLF